MMRTAFNTLALLIVILALAGVPVPRSLAQSAQIAVNSTADAVDASPGDGQCRTTAGVCTLRAAVQEANALAGRDTITLAAGTYTITIRGGDDIGATGDLDITSDLSIIGAGPNATVIDGNKVNRVFEIWNSSTQVSIAQLKIQNGQTQAGQSGGGVFNKGQAELENVIVTGNQAENGAGISSSGSLLVSGSTISSNAIADFGGSGGGIYSDGALTIDDSVVSDNHAFEDGGGIYHIGSALSINRSVIRDNIAEDGSGGGIFSSGAATLSNTSISDNTANTDIDGGGGINIVSGSLAATGSTINGNITAGDGGGIRNVDAMLLLRNSTISGNLAMQNAGGVFNSTGSMLSANSTFTGNSSSGAGGLSNIGGSMTLQNTLVAKNTGSSALDCSGTLTSQGYNFVGNTGGCALAAASGDQIGTSGNPINPKIGPLQNNGGATLTHAPLEGSPLIDAGNPGLVGQGGPTCEATDQIGTSRPQGSRCDIGAVELAVAVPAPVLNSIAPVSAKAGSAGFTLTIQGDHFANGATVRWNGAARPTTFVSSTALTAAISASDIRRAGSASITVANPAPGSGESNPGSFTITPGPAYIPFLVRSVPPRCDAYEPNDDRKVNPSGPILSGQLYRARICSDDPEDNYFFDAPTKGSVQIALSIPPSLAQHFAIGIYAQNALAFPLTSSGCYTNPVSNQQFAATCALPAAGRYIVRLYTTESAFDATTDYTLQVSYP